MEEHKESLDGTSESVNLPKVRDDIKCWLFYKRKSGNIYCLGSIKIDRYIYVKESDLKHIFFLLKLMDGRNNLNDIQNEIDKNKIAVNAEKVVDKFSKFGFLENGNSGKKFSETSRLTVTLGSIKIDKFVSRLDHILDYIIYFLLILSFFCFITMITEFIKNPLLFHNIFKFKNSYVGGLIISSLLISPLFLLHEFGHLCVALKYGLKPDKLIFALYLGLFPMFYLKIPGIYTLKRYRRILVMSAGIITNTLLALVLLTIIKFFGINILYPFVAANLQIAIVNLNPFVFTDGYFIISNILKESNLRKNMILRISGKSSRKFTTTMKVYLVLSLIFIIFMAAYESYWLMKSVEEVLTKYNIFMTHIQMLFSLILMVIICIISIFLLIKMRFRDG